MITVSFLMLSIEVLNQYHPRLDTIMDILTVSLLWDRLAVWRESINQRSTWYPYTQRQTVLHLSLGEYAENVQQRCI